MKLNSVRLLLMLVVLFGLLTVGFGQKAPESTNKSSSSPGAKKPADAASVFNLQQIHTIHLNLTAENWEKMQPPQRQGFGPGGMRPMGPPPFPPNPGELPPAGGGNVVFGPGPQGGPPQGRPPGRFGFEFAYVHGAVEVDGESFKDVAVRFKGNASYMSSQRGLKRPFKIDLNKYDKSAHFHGQTMLVLNNNIMDSSQMRETIAYPLFRAAGLPASRTGYAKVYLTVSGLHSREYLGLYTLVEYVNEEFLTQHFGNGDGLLLKPEGAPGGVPYLGESWDNYKERYDPKSGLKGKESEKAQRQLIEFTKLVNEGSDADFTKKIGDYLDVDAFTRFLAVNTLIANLDSILAMGHNYYIYLNPATNKFVFFPWDLDLSFAGFPMGGSAEQQLDLSIDHPHSGTNKLIERLLAMDEVKKQYYGHLQSLLKTSFNPAQLEKQIAAAEQLIRETVKAEPAPPTGGPMGRGGFGGGPGGMFGHGIPFREFIPRRVDSITAQLNGKSKGFVPQNRMRFGGGPGGPPGGGFMIRPGAMEAPQLLKAMDSDKSKHLSPSEFTTGATQFFTRADKDKNGRLSLDEVTNEMDSLLSQAGLMMPSFIVARSVLRLGDQDKDSHLTTAEWNEAVGKHFSEWDTNKNKNLDEPELTEGLGKLMTTGFPRFEPVPSAPTGEKPPDKN
ncbi:MAG TPA: CotH kinase family protein [Blastocatellia bacterium]|nr:CotH kinase family protein [Blastocatellia bacterium]